MVQRELVEKKRWMTNEEFVEDWAVAQIMPGPNVVNLSIMIGDRIDKDVMHILRFGTDIDRTGICPSRQAERSGPLFAPNLLAFCAARVEH